MAIRFKAMADQLPTELLTADYEGADRLGRFSVGVQCVYYSKLLGGVEYAPFAAIERAYRREEDCSSIMGCCRQSFEVQYLVLNLKGGKQRRLEADSKDAVQQTLELLRVRSPETAIGFVKETTAE